MESPGPPGLKRTIDAGKFQAELFQTTPQNITLHLKAIYAEGELAEAATCKDYLQIAEPKHHWLSARGGPI